MDTQEADTVVGRVITNVKVEEKLLRQVQFCGKATLTDLYSVCPPTMMVSEMTSILNKMVEEGRIAEIKVEVKTTSGTIVFHNYAPADTKVTVRRSFLTSVIN